MADARAAVGAAFAGWCERISLDRAGGAALAAAAVAVHANGFGGVFQFDDYLVIVHEPAVHSWAAWFQDLAGGIRPLLKASYTLNWTSGLGLFGFHAFNIAVHVLNTLLVWVLGRRIFTALTDWDESSRYTAAFLATALFALHPVQTEAVTYISGRSSSLMALFLLASLWAYARGRDERRAGLALVLSPLLFGLAVLAKEPAVTLPLALILWDRVVRQERRLAEIVRWHSVHWVLLAGGILLIAVNERYLELFVVSFETRGLFENLLSQINGVTYLVSRLVLFGRLNFDPDLPLFTRWHPVLVVEAGFLLALLITGILSVRRRPVVAFGILWFFLQVAPMTTFIPRLDFVNERHLYPSGWGLMLAFSWTVVAFARGRNARVLPVATAMTLLCIALAATTVVRNTVYRTEIALWEDTVKKSPNKARVHNNLGFLYLRAGRLDRARQSYRRALELDPGLAAARANLRRLEQAGLRGGEP